MSSRGTRCIHSTLFDAQNQPSIRLLQNQLYHNNRHIFVDAFESGRVFIDMIDFSVIIPVLCPVLKLSYLR